jgi:hypothetical protein
MQTQTSFASIPLGLPSFSQDQPGTIALAGCPRSAHQAIASGTAALGRITDGAGVTQVANLTVGLFGSPAHIHLQETEFRVDEVCTLTGGMIKHAG